MNSTDCPICFNRISHNNGVRLLCNHSFHTPCIKEWLNNSPEQNCPNCRKNLTYNERIHLSNTPFKNVQWLYDDLGEIDPEYALMIADSIEQLEEEEKELTLESVIQRIVDWKESAIEDDKHDLILLYTNIVNEANRLIN